MYKINDYVVYRHNVCQIKGIRNVKNNTYYIMTPIDDNTLTINVPTNDKKYLRDVINKEDADKLISTIPYISPLDNITDKNIENTYKELISNDNYEDLIKVIKTTHIRNDARKQNKKKISEKDDKYFQLAEKYLYNELSIALNMTFEEVRNYIISQFENN